MIFRLTSVIRFAVCESNRVNPNHLAGIQRRYYLHEIKLTINSKSIANDFLGLNSHVSVLHIP